MIIDLYNYAGDHRVVNKQLGSVVQPLDGKLRDDCDLINPVILIGADPRNCNYAHIPAFNRWYYITDVENIRTGLWMISCHVDVLMTYKDSIYQCEGVVDRCSKDGSVNNSSIGNNGFLQDSDVPILATNRHRQITLGSLGVLGNDGYRMSAYTYLVTVG